MTQYTPGVIVKEIKPLRRPRYHYYILAVLLLSLVLLPLLYIAQSWYSSAQLIDSGGRMAGPSDVRLCESLGSFTTNIYQSLAQQEGQGNLFFSPLSVMTALGMTMTGSRSNTQLQLAKLLNMEGASEEAVASAFSAALNKYTIAAEEYELRTANLMYSSNQLAMQQNFADLITGPFCATAKVVDFGGQTEAVRQDINTAVEKLTNSRIKDLIAPGILNSLTRLVLVNAVYFKGLWAKTFDKRRTVEQPFYVDETNSVPVPMMHLTHEFFMQHRADLQANVLSMDYKGSNLSLVLVLPDSRTGLSAVEEKLGNTDITKLLTEPALEKVQLSLPRFKLEYSKDLVKTLSEMGAKDLFVAGKSDLSGIGGEPGDLFVSNVIHKAFFELNEEGSEAAAATAMIAMTRMMMLPPPSFTADHPFMFLLQDKELKLTLFAGRYTTPEPAPAKVEL